MTQHFFCSTADATITGAHAPDLKRLMGTGNGHGNGNGHSAAHASRDFGDSEVVRIAVTNLEAASGETAERDGQIFRALSELTVAVRVAASDAKSASEVSTLLAAQFNVVHGAVLVAEKDMQRVHEELKEVRRNQGSYRDKLDSIEDITERRAIVTAEQAAKMATDSKLSEFKTELAKERAEKAERALEKHGDRGHDWKLMLGGKGVGVAISVGGVLIATIVYLLMHGSPFTH